MSQKTRGSGVAALCTRNPLSAVLPPGISFMGSFLPVVALESNSPQSVLGLASNAFPLRHSRRESLDFKNKRKPKSPAEQT